MFVGSIGLHTIAFTLETGADISIVPEETIPVELHTRWTVLIWDTNGGLKNRPTANLLICVAGS